MELIIKAPKIFTVLPNEEAGKICSLSIPYLLYVQWYSVFNFNNLNDLFGENGQRSIFISFNFIIIHIKQLCTNAPNK